MKQELIKLFSKEDWKFYNKYPRLFATYLSNKEFTFDDLNIWYNKFICNIDIFQNIVKTLYVINHNEENAEMYWNEEIENMKLQDELNFYKIELE